MFAKKNYVGGGMGVAAAAKYRMLHDISDINEQYQIDSAGTFRKERVIVPTITFFGGRTIPLNTKANLRFEPFCTMRLGKKLTAFSSVGTQISYGVSIILSLDTRKVSRRKEINI